jgi:hypothetical protein
MFRQRTYFGKLFSLNRHRKRWGASRHVVSGLDYELLKTKRVEGDVAKPTRGSVRSLDEHLANLRVEFAGQSELLWHHARLVVLLRREYQVKKTFEQFWALWEAQAAYLCDNLNLRWLVSATDSFADHHPNPAVRATAMVVSTLMVTLKIYETERALAYPAPAPLDPAKLQYVQSDMIPLFSGLSCFTVGSDDTLRNTRERLGNLMDDSPVGMILKTIFDRIHLEDTAFARLKAQHHRARTRWW